MKDPIRRLLPLLVFAAAIAHAQAMPPLLLPAMPVVSPDRGRIEALLAIIDAYEHSLGVIRDRYAQSVGSVGIDPAGRSLAQELSLYCHPLAAGRIDASLRAAVGTALGKGDVAAADRGMQRLVDRVSSDWDQCQALLEYWDRFVLAGPDFRPYEAMLAANGVTYGGGAQIAALQSQFEAAVAAGRFREGLTQIWPRLLAARDAAAAAAAPTLLARALHGGFHGLYETQTAECPPPATRTSGTPHPALDPLHRPEPLVYPAQASRLSETGAVRVGFVVSSLGCARRIFVLQSSGYELLDRAAVGYVAQGRYLPAELDGHAVEATTEQTVQFTLSNP